MRIEIFLERQAADPRECKEGPQEYKAGPREHKAIQQERNQAARTNCNKIPTKLTNWQPARWVDKSETAE